MPKCETGSDVYILSVTLSFGWFKLLLYFVRHGTIFIHDIFRLLALAWLGIKFSTAVKFSFGCTRFYRFYARSFFSSTDQSSIQINLLVCKMFVCFIEFSGQSRTVARFSAPFFWTKKQQRSSLSHIFFFAVATVATACWFTWCTTSMQKGMRVCIWKIFDNWILFPSKLN